MRFSAGKWALKTRPGSRPAGVEDERWESCNVAGFILDMAIRILLNS